MPSPAKDEAAGQVDNQPDGMCLDRAGNLYVAHFGMKQVQVLDPTGKLVARYDGGNLTTLIYGGSTITSSATNVARPYRCVFPLSNK